MKAGVVEILVFLAALCFQSIATLGCKEVVEEREGDSTV